MTIQQRDRIVAIDSTLFFYFHNSDRHLNPLD